jgi:hypothetical protein
MSQSIHNQAQMKGRMVAETQAVSFRPCKLEDILRMRAHLRSAVYNPGNNILTVQEKNLGSEGF